MTSSWRRYWIPIAAMGLLVGGVTWFRLEFQARPPAGITAAKANGVSLSTKPNEMEFRKRSQPPLLSSQNAPKAPDWAIPFGAEFWRRDKEGSATGKSQSAFSRVGLAQAIDRVSHAFQTNGTTVGVTVAEKGFRAQLFESGIRFSSAKELSPMGTLEFQTRSIARGAVASTADRACGWRVFGNTAQRRFATGLDVTEHFEATANGVQATWIAPKQPAGSGDLSIHISVDGADEVRENGRALIFSDAEQGAQLALGSVLVVDSAGRKWPAGLEIVDKTSARITVPESVLLEAEYPLAIDPVISATFGFDAPVDGLSLSTQGAPAVAANGSGYLVVWTHGKGDGTEPAVMSARLDAQGNLLDPYGLSLSSAAGEQTVCAVAGTSSGFLVVWSAPRPNSTTDWDILAMRVSNAGSPLEATPINVCTLGSAVQSSPAVAASDDRYLIVWRDGRQTGIYGSLMSTNGALSATNGFPICTAANDQYTPAVSALGTNFLVVWQDYREATLSQFTSDIYGARVTAGGAVIDTNGFAICTRTNSQFSPAVAANGSNWLVVWEDYEVRGNDISGSRVAQDGTVLDPEPLLLGHAENAQAYPAVVGGKDWLVLWQDYRDTSTNDYAAAIWANRISADGTVESEGGFPISDGGGAHWHSSAAANEPLCLIAWQDSDYGGSTLSDVMAATLNLTNKVVSSGLRVSRAVNAQSAPALAASDTNILAVWSDTRNATSSGRDIFGVRFNNTGALLDTVAVPICTATNQQAEPAVAANGTNFLVTWADWRNTPANANHADVYGTLMSLSGFVLQPDGIAICTATNDQRAPSVSVLGTNFIVVWSDPRRSPAGTSFDVFGARVSPTGLVLDPASIPISTNNANQSVPSVSGNAAQALVVWSDGRPGVSAADIYGARVAVDGGLLDTNGFAICTAALVQTNPAVATDGSNYMVVWADGRAGASAKFDIYGALVSRDAIVAPTNGVPIAVGAMLQDRPAVAFNGADYLVAWQQSRTGATNVFDIVASGVTVAGDNWPGGGLIIQSNALTPWVGTAGGSFVVGAQATDYAVSRAFGTIVDIQSLPRFSEPSASNSQFIVKLHGAIGQRYRVETSSDLSTWAELKTLTLTNNTESIVQTLTPNSGSQFYRATLLP